MPLLLTFSGIPEGDHTWYHDLDTGAIAQAFPTTSVPKRSVDDAEYYIDAGYAVESGEEDGSDGKLDRMTDALRAAFVAIEPTMLEGDPSSWTLDDMIEALGTMQEADTASQMAWFAPPVVSEVLPLDEAVDVPVDAVITVQFNKAHMDASTMIPGNFELKAADGIAIDRTIVDIEMDDAGGTATLILDAPLTEGRKYKVRVLVGVKDGAGNPLPGIYAQPTGFTIIDTQAPTVASTSPANAASDVAVDAVITVTFDEAVDAATVDETSIYLVAEGGGAADVATTSVAIDGTAKIATLTMAGPLTAATVYKIHVTTAVTDLSGTAIAAPYEQAAGFTTAAE
jgi:hypothetical protein